MKGPPFNFGMRKAERKAARRRKDTARLKQRYQDYREDYRDQSRIRSRKRRGIPLDAALGTRNEILTARCRWCTKEGIRHNDMAIVSWKPILNAFTGVCKECIDDPLAEARYHARMDARMSPAPL